MFIRGLFYLWLSALLGSTCAYAEKKAGDSPGQDSAEKPVPLYAVVLDSLKSNDLVKPAMPDVHPVSTVYNREAIIPPQCYTRTEGRFNPCYVCHQDAIEGRENVMNDGALQAAYSFSDLGTTNHWRNLFEDRSDRVKKISDNEILEWIAKDNYSALPQRLRQAGFEGWIPDLKNLQQSAGAFDQHGFAKDGSHWVAFNYKPLPSTFWPTNGSTDDVMIRLAKEFRSDSNGRYSIDIYRANLAILEAKIKGLTEISSLPVDEKKVGEDLNGDRKLSTIRHINQLDKYVGAAAEKFIDTYLYPEGTEFLHTVRYVGVDENGQIVPSTRMKEVRYMRKWRIYSKPVYARQYQLEGFEKEVGNLPGYHNVGDHGLDNGNGWSIQSFIEDRQGRLRVSTYEENLFCMGCHNSIGATIDKTFSFARKVDGAEGWRYIDLKDMPDAPNKGETRGEIVTYFERVGGGGEFRSNPEMQQRWFNPDGAVNFSKVAAARDVYDLITPSVERALELNKAYRLIVEDQDFVFGRDATVKPPANVYDRIDNTTSPTLPLHHTYRWDIRLDWESSSAGAMQAAK